MEEDPEANLKLVGIRVREKKKKKKKKVSNTHLLFPLLN